LEQAIQNVQKLCNRYEGEDEVPLNPDVEYFKRYGTGIYLFFHLVKRLAILFSIFAVISIVPICINASSGNAFSHMIVNLGIYFAETTVGNLNSAPMGITKLDQSSSIRYKMENAIPDLVICFMFLAFYIYWEVKSDRLAEEIKEEIRFQCHYTLEANEFTLGTTENEISQFFSQFGRIKEIAPVQDYS
jgi:hypothetical protein